MTAAPAPKWLTAAFKERGMGRPRLLRHGLCEVWVSGKAVAKVYDPFDTHRAFREVAAAMSAAPAVLTATPLGVSVHDRVAVSWWEKVDLKRPATPQEAAIWVRSLHDDATSSGLALVSAIAPIPPASGEAARLLDELTSMLAAAEKLWAVTSRLPWVLVHGGAGPSNIFHTAKGTLGLDFGSAGSGPRVIDLASIIVQAEESRAGTFEEVLRAYGEHPHVSEGSVREAMSVIQAGRAVVCARVPAWVSEGFKRLEAYRNGTVFTAPGGHLDLGQFPAVLAR